MQFTRLLALILMVIMWSPAISVAQGTPIRPANELTEASPADTDHLVGIVNPTDPATWDMVRFPINNILDLARAKTLFYGGVTDPEQWPAPAAGYGIGFNDAGAVFKWVPESGEGEQIVPGHWAELATGSVANLTGAFDLVNNDSKEISNLILFAGESIAEGQTLYGKYDGSNGMRLYLYSNAPGDADAFYKLGVARTAAAVGQPVLVFVGHSLLMRRDIFNFATSSLGKPLWAYSTPGAIGTTVPSTELHHVIKVGTAVATDGVDGITGSYILYRFSIDDTQIPPAPVE